MSGGKGHCDGKTYAANKPGRANDGGSLAAEMARLASDTLLVIIVMKLNVNRNLPIINSSNCLPSETKFYDLCELI